jgi:acylglycerol lipase
MNRQANSGICRKEVIALTVSSLLASSLCLSQGAEAFWPFTHKKKGEADSVSRKRKKREISAATVGLVPGNPPAMYWRTDGAPRAALLCLHELGMYGGVFDDLGKRMSKTGIATYAIDLRGFGGWRDVDSKESKMDLDRTLEDVKGSVEIIKKLHPNVPVFVLGEAMGGALALEAAQKFPQIISGVISAAPGGEHYKTVDSYLTVASSLAVGSKAAFGLGEELLDAASPKQELKDAFRDDEMVRLDLSPRELMACQFYMYKTKKMARDIKNTPVLVVHGAKDGESRIVGSKAVYENLATKDKDFLVIEDGDHYTFEDVKVDDKALNSALSFIDKHITAGEK